MVKQPVVSCPNSSNHSVVVTRAALQALAREDMERALDRHFKGDWGDLVEEDKAANEVALLDGSRLLSTYHDRNGVKFWIITEADRSLTTVLLPEDY